MPQASVNEIVNDAAKNSLKKRTFAENQLTTPKAKALIFQQYLTSPNTT
jgi:hypothetical protein